MKIVAVGQAPVGVIAVGQVPLGVLAIGQGARGVIAIGQLACGVIAIGQLAVGLVAFGQLALGGVWGGGMLSISSVGGPSLIGWGPVGELGLRDLYRLRWGRFRAAGRTPVRLAGAAIIVVVAALIVWFASLSPMIDELRHDGDADIQEPVLR